MARYNLPLHQSLRWMYNMHEDWGSCSHPKKFHFKKWLEYALSTILGSNLSVEVLKEYGDAVAESEDMLTHHGVKSDGKA